jgi:hypothetical protein
MEDNNQKIRQIKGSIKLFPSDRMEFTPYDQGEPQMERVKATPNGSLSRTTGDKQQSWCVRLKVPVEVTDPAAEMRDELEKVVKALPESRRKPSPKGRTLMNQDGCQVTLNRSKGRIEIGMTIDLTTVINVKQFFTKKARGWRDVENQSQAAART